MLQLMSLVSYKSYKFVSKSKLISHLQYSNYIFCQFVLYIKPAGKRWVFLMLFLLAISNIIPDNAFMFILVKMHFALWITFLHKWIPVIPSSTETIYQIARHYHIDRAWYIRAFHFMWPSWKTLPICTLAIRGLQVREFPLQRNTILHQSTRLSWE